MSLLGQWHLLQWREPLWLLLVLQPLLIWLLQRRGKNKRLSAYADPALLPWLEVHPRRHLRQRLLSRNNSYVLAWLLFAIAAAGPRIAEPVPGQEPTSGLDIMLVLDVSRSMNATDIKPSRLQRARIEIHELMTRADNTRIGLIVYSARPHLFVPLTSDQNALAFYLEMLDAVTLPTYGSQTADALALARKELTSSKQSPLVLLITDGDLNETGDAGRTLFDAVQNLTRDNIPLFILGIGSVEGDAIPLAEGGWLKKDGKAVISRMDETPLQQLAKAGKGIYRPVSDDDSDWQTLYDHGMQQQARIMPADKDRDDIIWREYYPWALFPAILLLFVSILPYRIPFLVHQTARNTTAHFLLAFALGLSLLIYPAEKGFAVDDPSGKLHAAYLAFSKQDYSIAQELYETLPGYRGRFGEGASRYRQGDFAGSVRQFGQAALSAQTSQQRGLALYNLGNSYVQQGNYKLASQVYEDALAYFPQHQASRKNLETSLALQALVEEQLINDILSGRTSRAGRGPRSATAEAETELDESSSISLADETEGKSGESPLPALPAQGDPQLAALIQKGVEYARLAAQGTSKTHYPDRQQNIIDARMQMYELDDSKARHWKRLFEIEEGFPAPLETRKTVPGVKPW